jgi:hypothetical protein
VLDGLHRRDERNRTHRCRVRSPRCRCPDSCRRKTVRRHGEVQLDNNLGRSQESARSRRSPRGAVDPPEHVRRASRRHGGRRRLRRRAARARRLGTTAQDRRTLRAGPPHCGPGLRTGSVWS